MLQTLRKPCCTDCRKTLQCGISGVFSIHQSYWVIYGSEDFLVEKNAFCMVVVSKSFRFIVEHLVSGHFSRGGDSLVTLVRCVLHFGRRLRLLLKGFFGYIGPTKFSDPQDWRQRKV